MSIIVPERYLETCYPATERGVDTLIDNLEMFPTRSVLQALFKTTNSRCFLHPPIQQRYSPPPQSLEKFCDRFLLAEERDPDFLVGLITSAMSVGFHEFACKLLRHCSSDTVGILDNSEFRQLVINRIVKMPNLWLFMTDGKTIFETLSTECILCYFPVCGTQDFHFNLAQQKLMYERAVALFRKSSDSAETHILFFLDHSVPYMQTELSEAIILEDLVRPGMRNIKEKFTWDVLNRICRLFPTLLYVRDKWGRTADFYCPDLLKFKIIEESHATKVAGLNSIDPDVFGD